MKNSQDKKRRPRSHYALPMVLAGLVVILAVALGYTLTRGESGQEAELNNLPNYTEVKGKSWLTVSNTRSSPDSGVRMPRSRLWNSPILNVPPAKMDTKLHAAVYQRLCGYRQG